MFPISRDPPEGGTGEVHSPVPAVVVCMFPISRDPPEGGTFSTRILGKGRVMFPVSRDPPEGGTLLECVLSL